MTLRFLLDTNILAEAMRPRPATSIARRLQVHGTECAIAAPVWHELRFGIARLPASRRRRALEAFVDGQIAAIAAVNDLVLVTRNARDFAAFDALELDAWA